MTKQEVRTRVEAELLSGVDARSLETKYDVPYVTINSWKNKLDKEDVPVAISEMTHKTTAALEIVRDRAKEQAPKVAGKIDQIIDGIEGLQELEPAFQTAMLKSVQMAQSFLDHKDDEGKSDVTIKEWQIITNTLAQAYGALFNKAGTTVNVAQTNVNAANENLAFFKASQSTI